MAAMAELLELISRRKQEIKTGQEEREETKDAELKKTEKIRDRVCGLDSESDGWNNTLGALNGSDSSVDPIVIDSQLSSLTVSNGDGMSIAEGGRKYEKWELEEIRNRNSHHLNVLWSELAKEKRDVFQELKSISFSESLSVDSKMKNKYSRKGRSESNIGEKFEFEYTVSKVKVGHSIHYGQPNTTGEGVIPGEGENNTMRSQQESEGEGAQKSSADQNSEKLNVREAKVENCHEVKEAELYDDGDEEEEEEESFQMKAFMVTGKPNFDMEEPLDGFEYLRRVKWERDRCPKIKISNIDPKKFEKKQTSYIPKIEKIAKCSDQFLPKKEWQQTFLFEFSELRTKLSDLKFDESESVEEFPSIENVNEWHNVIFGSPLPEKSELEDDTKSFAEKLVSENYQLENSYEISAESTKSNQAQIYSQYQSVDLNETHEAYGANGTGIKRINESENDCERISNTGSDSDLESHSSCENDSSNQNRSNHDKISETHSGCHNGIETEGKDIIENNLNGNNESFGVPTVDDSGKYENGACNVGPENGKETEKKTREVEGEIDNLNTTGTIKHSIIKNERENERKDIEKEDEKGEEMREDIQEQKEVKYKDKVKDKKEMELVQEIEEDNVKKGKKEKKGKKIRNDEKQDSKENAEKSKNLEDGVAMKFSTVSYAPIEKSYSHDGEIEKSDKLHLSNLNPSPSVLQYPTPKGLLKLDQVSRAILLRRLVKWVQDLQSIDERCAIWLFSLSAVVDKPLDDVTLASYRSLLRFCSKCRAQIMDLDDPQLIILNILITIAGKYFGQEGDEDEGENDIGDGNGNDK